MRSHFPGLAAWQLPLDIRGGWWALCTLLSCGYVQAQTTLTTGDIAIVGIAGCPAGSADKVSFFCFKAITTGTTLDLTDNGYQRCIVGKFGNTEGTIRMTRTGGTIAAGTVITFQLNNSTTITPLTPDASWTSTSLNSPGLMGLAAGGDQLIIMQGGTWVQGTYGSSDATYSGRFIAALSTNPSPPWTANCTTSPTQRSDPPPGVGCLAVRPLSSTAWDKYTGPTTAATQKDWLFRIALDANWSGLGSCSAYTAAAPDWDAAPVMPILPPTATTNGLWTGNKGTDWFDLCNWDDLQVPTATSNVQIDQNGVNNCVIGPSTYVASTATANCQTLTVTSNTAVNNGLTISNSRTLNVSGLTLITKATSGLGQVGITVTSGAANLGSLIIDGSSAGAQEGFYRSEAATGTTTVNGNVTIETGGLLDLQPASGSGGVLKVNGNWTNNDGEPSFQEVGSSVQFTGSTADQTITTVSSYERFNHLTIDKPAFSVVLNSNVRMGGILLLNNGRIKSGASTLFTLEAGATSSAGTDASHVDGPMQKTGATNFSFPVGKGGQWRPISIGSIAGSSTYTAEYFPASAIGTFGAAHDATLDHISDCEYWQLSPSSASTATVTLTWDTPNSCGVTLPPDLRVANWDGAAWRDRGNSAATALAATGSVSSGAGQSAFGPFALASISTQNPLPIQLLHFGASPDGDEVALDWTTASERDNDYFTVERSADLSAFTSVCHVPGAGNSQQVLQYTERDRFPLPGLSYYRLRQTDLDGGSTVSDLVPVDRGTGGTTNVIVRSTPEGLLVFHDLPAGSHAEVIDATGRVCWQGTLPNTGSSTLPTPAMPAGAYVLRLWNGERVGLGRFVQ